MPLGLFSFVPDGLGWYQSLGLIGSVASQAKIIGFDLTEFSMPISFLHQFLFMKRWG
jgi:arginase family enzyme|tara:strand:+ start:102 stop:272 length:171 start_codon:yes stop_codon:yes gene_type:complete